MSKRSTLANRRPTDETGRAKNTFEELARTPADVPRRQLLRDQLVLEHLPVAHHIAQRYRHRGVPLEDLRQVATVGLIHAVDRFDPDRGRDFLAFAVPTILGEVRRHFRDKGWAVHVPRRFRDMRGRLTAAIDQLAQELGRAPTPSELAQHMDLPRDEVIEGLAARDHYGTGTLDSLSQHTSQAVSAATQTTDINFELIENRHALRPLIEALPERERRIIALRFFENQTQTQIAENLGISQMHVSRLLVRILQQLREGLDAESAET